MSKLTLPLLAFALAIALSASPSAAQQITTSHGVRSLPKANPSASAVQLRQNINSAEQVLVELMEDIARIEAARGSAVGDTGSLSERVKRENAEYERNKAAFKVIDQKYRDDLAAFQQRSSRLDADVQQQRTEAESIQALPSAQRDINQVLRLNDWATKLGTERQAIETERNRLLADHTTVEAERVKLEKSRVDAEAKLKGIRDNAVGRMDSTEQKRISAYGQLRATVNYLRVVRDQLGRMSGGKAPRSQVYDQANAKVSAFYDAESRAKR